MEVFTSQNSGELFRQTYVANKSSYISVGTINFYLKPLTEEQSAANGVQFGLGFSIITEVDVDIREGDKLTSNSVDYTIRGVVNHNRGIRVQYKRALALKAENQ